MKPVIAALLAGVYALRQAVYDRNLTTGYIQADNGTLYRLNVSRDATTASQIAKSAIEELPYAPANSTLIVDGDGHLIAVWGTSCGESPIQISSYDSAEEKWKSLAQSAGKWYVEDSTIWYDLPTDTLFIYGGSCPTTTPESSFYSYSFSSRKWVQLHPSLMPVEMASAAAIAISDSETLVIGGHAESGWMSMEQLAVWQHNSWSFVSVNDSEKIDSRDSPLLLPLWSQTDTGPLLTSVLAVGGEVQGRQAAPVVAMLSLNLTSGWTWQSTPLKLTELDLAATLYETFLKVDESGSFSLYNGQTQFSNTHSVLVPKVTSSSSTSSSQGGVSTTAIAVMSTLFPLAALILLGVGGWWLWRRRRVTSAFGSRSRQMGGHIRRISSPPLRSTDTVVVPGLGYMVPPLPTLDEEGECDDVDSVFGVNRTQNSVVGSNSRHVLRVVNPDDDLISLNSTESGSGSVSTSPGSNYREKISDSEPKPDQKFESSDSGSEYNSDGRNGSWRASQSVENPFTDNEEFDFGPDSSPTFPSTGQVRRRVTP